MIYGIIYIVIAVIVFYSLYAYFCKEYKSSGSKDNLGRWLYKKDYDSLLVIGSAAWIFGLILIPFLCVGKMIRKHYNID